MAQTTTDTSASTVSGAGAASSFSGSTGTEAEFGSLGALSPTWWEPEDGSEPEPWLTPDQAFERFFEWTSDRGIELWDHQEEALMDLAAGDHADVIAAEHLHKVEELFADQGLDGGRVITTLTLRHAHKEHTQRDERFTRSGRCA